MQVIGSGWAVLAANDQADLRTVAQHRRAAIVNWLVVSGGVWITRDTTDEEIEAHWSRLGPLNGVRVEEILICQKESL